MLQIIRNFQVFIFTMSNFSYIQWIVVFAPICYSGHGAFLLFVIMRKVFIFLSRLYRLLLIGV